MKKLKTVINKLLFSSILLFTIITITAVSNKYISVYAFVKDSEQVTLIKEVTNDLFNNVEISSMEYLYNLDESPDYIYVEFEGSGYVVYSSETLDVMEYSLKGSLPYNTDEKKYYAGPTNYLKKEKENFKNVTTNEVITKAESTSYVEMSKEVLVKSETRQGKARKSILKEKNKLNNNKIAVRKLNAGGTTIPAGISGTNVKYITNADYFLIGPHHGHNSSGTCDSVAAQLLISYHNYYSDRRLIDNKYLFDGEDNPNTCTNPLKMTSETLGTRGINEDGSDETYSYFHKVVSTIKGKFGMGAQKQVEGMNALFSERKKELNLNEDLAEAHFYLLGVESSVKSEIDQNYPVIIGFRHNANSYHAVVGYGYQTLGGSGTNQDGQFGFIVHYGWATTHDWTSKSNMWINESWCMSYTWMRVPHVHELEYKGNVPNEYYEKECTICGYRTSYLPLQTRVVNDEAIIKGTILNGSPAPLPADFIIPSRVNMFPVVGIDPNAFANQTNIVSLTLPVRLRTIDDGAFSGCTNLRTINLPDSVTTIGENAFPTTSRVSWTYSPYVTASALGITQILEEVIVKSDTKKIKAQAFQNCVNLTEAEIKSDEFGIGIIGIEEKAFDGCTNLQCIKILESVESIGTAAFRNCASLVTDDNTQPEIKWSINLPFAVENLENSVFEGCTSLKKVVWHYNLKTIGNATFKNCPLLNDILIPNSTTSIGNDAFNGCTSLSNITINNGITSIGNRAFSGCSLLYTINLPNTLESIGNFAFKDCTNLRKIVLPESVTNIGFYAFMNCNKLSEVTIKRTNSDITTLGENAFYGCASTLQIDVPIIRFNDYKTASNWNDYASMIKYNELTVSCENDTSTQYNLSVNSYKQYQLNVNCAKTYKIETTSSNDVKIIVYNSNYTVVDTFINQKDIYLGVGTYYISVEFNSLESSGNVELNISLRWPSTDVGLVSGINDIKSNLHNTLDNVCHGKFYYNNNQGKGLFRFTLNTSANTYLNGTIKIYDSSRRQVVLDRYNISNETNQASSKIDENTIYVYLPSNGAFYIDIVLPTSNYSTISLEIEKVENNSIDYSNTLSSTTLTELFSYETFTSYFTEVTISHKSLFELDIITNGTVNNNINIYILKKQLLPGYDTNEYYEIIQKVKVQITSSDHSPVCSSILEEGTYYIGYDNNIDKANISIALVRKVNSNINVLETLVTDPAYNEGYPLGSEVTLNNGVLRGNTITEGFTRNIYLMVEDRLRDPISRLDYDWYSSDENIAKVTAYGTVLALNVTEDKTVTIYAVLKTDPSIVYAKTFTILKETKTEVIVLESNMTYSYSEENGMYTLELNFTNSPYPYVGYYEWSINCIDDISVDMNHALLITSSGVGRVDLTGSYSLNSRIFLYIHLTITE